MPLRELPTKQTEKICPRCNAFLTFDRNHSSYICERCGTVFQKNEILAGKIKSKKKIVIPTRKKMIESEYGDLLDEMANYNPELDE